MDMIDDDVVNCGYNFLDTRRTKKIQIKEEGLIEEFLKYFDLCDQLGYKI